MIRFARVNVGNVCWEIRADLRALLLDEDGLRLHEWVAGRQACAVKDGPHRTVYRLELPGAHLYMKHYKVPDLSALLGNLFRASKAQRESRLAQQLARRGIATITPVAVGERRKAGLVTENFLVTETIVGTTSLRDYFKNVLPTLPPQRQARVRRDLALRLADWTARVHEAGVRHGDYHAGNLLVETEEGRPVRFHLLDLHSARMDSPLGWRCARGSLVELGVSFFQRTTRSDRARFFRRYLARRPGLVRDRAAAAREVERLAQRVRRRFWRRREQRCIRSNRHFYRRSIGRTRGHAIRQMPEAVLDDLMLAPDRLFDDPAALTIKDSEQSRVARVDLPLMPGGSRCVLKRSASKGWWHDLWRGSPARRAWRAAHALLLRGIDTPQPLMMLERRGLGRDQASYLLTRWITGGTTLRDYAGRVIPALSPRERKRQIRSLGRELGRFVRRLHEHGFDQRDLKAPNFVIAAAAPETESAATFLADADRQSFGDPSSEPVVFDGGPRVYLVDLDGLKARRNMSLRRRVQNLSRLNASFFENSLVTRTERLRFLREYLPGGLGGAFDWKELWRQIESRTRRKIRRNHRRGRVIA